ncbi:MAG: dimethyl sulfoxide reductase anchor subunit [Candidatus Aminicenantes bacterium]|nr:dimethyl sulfoxide reductase anchor subunit [Candidatus Aminicenantes bacterium]
MMVSDSWPLICFSVLMQMSVGCFIISEFICLTYSRRFSSAGLRLLRLLSRFLVLVLSLLAVALSFFHLGKPWRAFGILNNLGSSWLSREIICILVFILFVAVGTILEWRKVRGQIIQQVLFLTGGLSGLFIVISMFRLYMLPTVPGWNHFATPSIFLLACFLLGGQLTAVSWTAYLDKSKNLLLQEIRTYWNQKTLGQVENLSLVLTVFIILVNALLFIQSGSFSQSDEAVLRPVFQNNAVVLVIRILLSLWGLLILARGWIPFRLFPDKKQSNHRYVYFAFLVLFLAEVLGRTLFYAVYFRLGI